MNWQQNLSAVHYQCQYCLLYSHDCYHSPLVLHLLRHGKISISNMSVLCLLCMKLAPNPRWFLQVLHIIFLHLCQMNDYGETAILKTCYADPNFFSGQPCCTFLRHLRFPDLMQIMGRIHHQYSFFKTFTFAQRSHFQIWLYDILEILERGCDEVHDLSESLEILQNVVEHMELQTEQVYVVKCAENFFSCLRYYILFMYRCKLRRRRISNPGDSIW